MFCATCEKECSKTHPQYNLHRFVQEIQCCERDCSKPLVVGGEKKEEYRSVTRSTFRCKKCYNRVYHQQQKKSKKSLSERLFPRHGGPGSIPSTRKCIDCECTAQDYKGNWNKMHKGNILHALFQRYRCRKCYNAANR